MSKQLPYYEVEGKRFDRITAILDYFPDPDLVSWKVRVGGKEASRIGTIAKNIGSNVDEVIKAEIDGLKSCKLKSNEAKNCHSAFNDWAKDYSLMLRSCQTVYSNELMVAGTPDIEDSDTVIDIKCSSSIKDSYWLQTEFYGRLLNKQFKAILRLDKNLAIYEFKKMPLNDTHWAAVCGLITAYRFFNKTVTNGMEVV